MRPYLLALLALTGCATTDGPNYLGTVSSVDAETAQLRSQPSVNLTPSIEISAETLGVAGAIHVLGHPVNSLGLPGKIFSPQNAALLYLLYDPLAPNWSIRERAVNAETYHLALRAKSFRTGGDGEAVQILKRRARQLQLEKGFGGYLILDYSEGVESSTPLTHRVSEGTIKLVKSPVPIR